MQGRFIQGREVVSATSGNSNIFRLATAQALAGGTSVIVYATGAIVGDTLTLSKHRVWRSIQERTS